MTAEEIRQEINRHLGEEAVPPEAAELAGGLEHPVDVFLVDRAIYALTTDGQLAYRMRPTLTGEEFEVWQNGRMLRRRVEGLPTNN